MIEDYRTSEIPTPTGIHTKINDTMRISSAWRKYGNEHFTNRAWETFLWDGDKIILEFDTLKNADDVVQLHFEILSERSKAE